MKRWSALTLIGLAVLTLGASAAMIQTTTPKPSPTYER